MANVKENQNVETLNSKEAFFLKYKKAIVKLAKDNSISFN